MNRFKFNPRKIKVSEIINFRGILDPDHKHNMPSQYVEGTNNLPSVKIREMNSRSGSALGEAYDSSINTGSKMLVSRMIAEGNNIHAETLSLLTPRSITVYPPPSGGGGPIIPFVGPTPPEPEVPAVQGPLEFNVVHGVDGFPEPFALGLSDLYTYDFMVDWGDGSEPDHITDANQPEISHVYPYDDNKYLVSIDGLCPYFNMHDTPYNNRIYVTDVVNIGTTFLTTLNFGQCINMETISSGVCDTSYLVDAEDLFHNCYQVTSFDISTMTFANVTTLAYAFRSCGWFNETYLDNVPTDTGNCTNMNYTFAGMYMSDTVIAQFDTSKVTFMNSTFLGYRGTTLNIPNFVTSACIEMGGFLYGTYVTTIDMTNWDTSNVTNMFQVMRSNPDLTTFMPSALFWDVAREYNENAFQSSTSISNYASIPSSWK